MNPSLTLNLPSPLLPPEAFLGQCAALGQSIFARLHGLIENPSPDQDLANSPARLSIANLECASRILKRIQDTYLSAQKAIAATMPAKSAEPKLQKTPSPKTVLSPPASTKEAIDNLRAAVKALNAIHTAPKTLVPSAQSPIPDDISPNPEDEDLADDEIRLPEDLQDEAASQAENAPATEPAPAPKYQPPFRPPLTRNQRKAARRKAKGKR